MSSNTVTRYVLLVKPKVWSPFKKGYIWNPTANAFRRAWVTRFRRVYVTEDGFYSLRHGGGAHGLLGVIEKNKAVAHFKKKQWDVQVAEKEIELYPHLTGDTDCKPALLKALNRAAKEIGEKIHIASGRRVLEEQQALYDDYKAGRGPLAAVPNANAPHIRGIAADCWINGVNALKWNDAKVRAAFIKHKLCMPVVGETWHVQLESDTPGLKWAV